MDTKEMKSNEARYIELERDYERWINTVQSSEILSEKLEQHKYWGLKCLKNKIEKAFQHTNKLYKATLNQAKKIRMDVSNYPETLEEIAA